MRATSVLVGILLVAIVATPALAGPEEAGKARRAEAGDLEGRIQKLTKELKKLEKLEKQRRKARAARPDGKTSDEAAERLTAGRRTLVEQQPRMAEARRRLAGLLAERGRADAPEAPVPPQTPRRRRASQPGQGPEWMRALRRLHGENRKLAARIQVLEHQIRRIGAAIAGLGGAGHDRPGRPEHAGRPRPGQPHAERRRAAGRPPEGTRGPASIEARLARLEHAVRALVAQERRGEHAERRRGARGWRPGRGMRHPGMRTWARRGHGRGQGVGQRVGPNAGPRGPRARRGAHGGARGGPAWGRMLRHQNRMHRPAARGTDGPHRGFGRGGGRRGEGPMQRGRGRPRGPCPFCAS